ncbi:MAG TPA: sulfotransferase [Solirubrobacteraceae bacterium]|nr:sulfotransferase [Solirubrobacteraceae bacterium]
MTATPEHGAAGSTVAAAAGTGRVPDFFIVGHPKCGTTALYQMLGRHPQIYMPENKEPRFFAPELWSRFGDRASPQAKRLHTLDGYLALFAGARADQRVGEATTAYLRSQTAAARIAQAQPAARIIAILREPASFLRSYHLQLVKSNAETERDFRRAIALEDERRAGRSIPRGCHSPPALLYSEHVRYVQQLRRYHDVFPAEQVLVLIYDDFRADNQATMRRVLRFLQVDDTAEIEPVETKRVKAVRALALHRLADGVRVARRNPAGASATARAVNALTPAALRSDAVRSLWRRAVYAPPPPVDEAFMLELRRHFEPEVRAISEYLGRDLVSLWRYDELA